ncbi:ABC transporter substrate-binding protein [Kribbia dieselivorans]|uniref:ABC transporter substrate-binding protein n=1 Tax=Kribbia dieselivorans TaxID=331526 RepID=UPI000837DE89|nr:ABC transporter substrate-binding protein [Kribbia dieselivorans]
MRTRLIRLASVTTIAGLGLATVAACGSGSAGGSGDNSEILIGGLWATSGAQAVYGDYFGNGAKLAVKDINDAGGVGGKTPLKLQVEDTQALPEPAVTAFQKLVGEDVKMVLSSFSSQTLALMPIAESRKIPVINGGAQSNALGDQKFLLNTIPLVRNESEVLAKYLVKEKKYTKAAVIYTSDDGGRAAKDSFEEAYKAAGGNIVAEESGKYQGTDYRSQLTKLRSSGADFLLIGAFGQDTNNIVSQAREIGWKVQMANTSWAAIPDVLKNKSAEGLILTSIPFEPKADFVQRYEKEYGEKPASSYIGNYYDAVQVFSQGYAKAAEANANPSGEEIIKAINDIKTFDSSYGSKLTFENGVASRPINIGEITGGAVTTLVKNYQG